jgi:hypothetical protein
VGPGLEVVAGTVIKRDNAPLVTPAMRAQPSGTAMSHHPSTVPGHALLFEAAVVGRECGTVSAAAVPTLAPSAMTVSPLRHAMLLSSRCSLQTTRGAEPGIRLAPRATRDVVPNQFRHDPCG